MAHRYIAGAFVFLLVPLLIHAWKKRAELAWARPFAIVLGVLYTAQVLVGALNVWYTFPDELTVSHTVLAASIWFALSVGVALTYYAPAAESRANRLARAGAPA